ncbi:MAG: RibD family protein, partial [Gammaproteobacteria bacterium]
KQPTRIVLSGRNPLPLDLNIFNDNLPGKTIIVTTQKTENVYKQIKTHNVELLIIPENQDKQISLPILLDELGKKEITSLLVEGGMTVHESFLKENLVNKIHVYLAPTFIGSLEKKRPLNGVNFYRIGRDFHFTADVEEVTYV